jgi:hypothetical protein
VDSSFFTALATLAGLLAPQGAAELRLVYGGNTERLQQGVRVLPWHALAELDW